MRRTTVAAVALTMLASTSVGAAAQMNMEEVPATFVTGIARMDGVPIEESGRITYEQTVAWSDPRLPSTLRVNATWYVYGTLPAGAEGEDPEIVAQQLVLVIDMHCLLDGLEGSWRGTGRGVEQGVGEDAARRYSTYVLVGEGAYAGMHLLLRGAPGHDADGPWDERYEGWLIETEVPPLSQAPTMPSG